MIEEKKRKKREDNCTGIKDPLCTFLLLFLPLRPPELKVQPE